MNNEPKQAGTDTQAIIHARRMELFIAQGRKSTVTHPKIVPLDASITEVNLSKPPTQANQGQL